MISHILELIIDGVITIFMKQRWYFAILYTIAMLSLVAATALAVAYLASSWLFSPQTTASNSILSVVTFFGAIALWWAFFALARKTAVS